MVFLLRCGVCIYVYIHAFFLLGGRGGVFVQLEENYFKACHV